MFLFVPGDALESTSYFVWRSILDHLLDLNTLAGKAERRQKILCLLAEEPELLPLAPLLNLVLSVEFPQNEASSKVPLNAIR